jgi:hypothetical protein
MNVLIKQDGLYYSINNEYYDSKTNSYTPLVSADFTKGFDAINLNKKLEIQGQPVDKTPKMISNILPSPYKVSSSSFYNADYEPWKAFNGVNSAITDAWLTAQGSVSGWIMIDMSVQTKINNFNLISRNSTNSHETSPKNFTLQGSNDGLIFTTLKTVVNEIGWTANEKRNYMLDQDVEYRYYKIDTTLNNGNINVVAIGKIEFLYTELLDNFKPIDKFTNFQLVTQTKPTSIKLSATKTSSELIVASDDISTLVANNINSFKLLSNQSLNGAIKLAVSIDKGLNWLTHNGSEFISINVNIPLKKYKLMSALEKNNYNLSKEEIFLNGIDSATLNTLDFNTLSAHTLRFAYVLSRPLYLSVSENHKLNWQFDSLGCMQRMKRSEFECILYSGGIGLKYLVESAIIKADIMVSEDIRMS